MHLSATFSASLRHRARRASLAALCVAAFAALAVLPTASARAGTQSSPAIEAPATITGVPQGQLETLLAGLPLGELSPAEVGKAIAELPSLGLLPTSKLEEAATKAVETLVGKGDSLGQLLNPADVVSGLETQLKKLLSLTEILNLLEGKNLTTLLTSALGTLSPSELLGALLENAGEPEKLLAKVLGALNPSELEALLGSPLGKTSFVSSTVGALAGELGITGKALAEQLGLNPLTLSPSSLALTEVLPNGTTLGVVDGLKGVSLALFKALGGLTGEGGGEGGAGGSGGAGGNGGGSGSGPGASGGAGGSSSGTPGSGPATGATVVVNYPGAGGSTPAASPTATSAARKVKILSHKVRHGVATIVLQVPAAGRVTLTGAGVRTVHGQATKAGRLTLRTRLTRAARARHGKRRATNVRLTVAFAQTGGPSSAAKATVKFVG